MSTTNLSVDGTQDIRSEAAGSGSVQRMEHDGAPLSQQPTQQHEYWGTVRSDQTGNIMFGRGMVTRDSPIYELICKIQLGEISAEQMKECSVSFGESQTMASAVATETEQGETGPGGKAQSQRTGMITGAIPRVGQPQSQLVAPPLAVQRG